MLTNYNLMNSREKEHQEKLRAAESKAATDPLTGIKNRLAYEHYERNLNDQIIRKDQDTEFAIVIADVNDLKAVNDNIGHSAGDECIRNACKRICHTYQHSPVFRIGAGCGLREPGKAAGRDTEYAGSESYWLITGSWNG